MNLIDFQAILGANNIEPKIETPIPTLSNEQP